MLCILHVNREFYGVLAFIGILIPSDFDFFLVDDARIHLHGQDFNHVLLIVYNIFLNNDHKQKVVLPSLVVIGRFFRFHLKSPHLL